MADSRILNTDGLPFPYERSMADFLRDGLEAFPTPLTEALVKSCGWGWTNGHTHMGLQALCMNEKGENNITNFEYFCRGIGKTSGDVANPIEWTLAEKNKVKERQKTKVAGVVRYFHADY